MVCEGCRRKKLRARLDIPAGANFEGIRPDITDADNTAISIYNACASGMGGIDWAGVELLAALYQVEDVEGLLERLVVIKTHTPKDRTI